MKQEDIIESVNISLNSFQRLLSRNKDGKISGPLGPVTFAKAVADGLEFKFHSICRWSYGQNYDFLLFKTQYKSCNWYALIADMGVSGLPIAMWYDNEKTATITPVYLKQLGNMRHHYDNCELNPVYDLPPIPEITEKQARKLFQNAELSGCFDYDKK